MANHVDPDQSEMLHSTAPLLRLSVPIIRVVMVLFHYTMGFVFNDLSETAGLSNEYISYIR